MAEIPDGFHELDLKKHGIVGLSKTYPAPREQDAEAEPAKYFAVEFFPKFELGFHAQLSMRARDTLAQTREAAIMKFMDGIRAGEDWASYEAAGWRVRRVKIVDLGDA